MKKHEVVSLAGLRQDGRRVNEWRPIKFQCNVLHAADGSCALQCGNTSVLVAVYGPKAIERYAEPSAIHHDDAAGAQITCDVVVAAFSGQRHRVVQGDRHSATLANTIVETFRSVIFHTMYPNSQIDIHVQVLQDDGGVEPCIVNAVSIALQDAHIPMRDFAVCTNVITVGDHIIVDPTKKETLASGGDLWLVTNAHRTEDVVSLRMDRRVREGEFDKLMQGAAEACSSLYRTVEPTLRDYMESKMT
eukprot:PhF_6_TR24015/c0_g1_i1/m.33623/K11600/RRP41, EXOSC4, SKI6; exosome complex component RRP41